MAQLTEIKRAVKSMGDAEILHVGFPKTTLDKYKLDGTEVIENENNVVLRCSIFAMQAINFNN